MAKGNLRGRLPEDILRGALILTDSICLYLYRNFAEERMNGGIVTTRPYQELDGLRNFILSTWGKISNNTFNKPFLDEFKDMAKGMMGLM